MHRERSTEALTAMTQGNEGGGFRHGGHSEKYRKREVVVDDNLLAATPYVRSPTALQTSLSHPTGVGSRYPTISVKGMAAIEPNISGPHLYAPYMEIFGKTTNPTYVLLCPHNVPRTVSAHSVHSGAKRGRRLSVGSQIVATSQTVPGGLQATRARRSSIGMPVRATMCSAPRSSAQSRVLHLLTFGAPRCAGFDACPHWTGWRRALERLQGRTRCVAHW